MNATTKTRRRDVFLYDMNSGAEKLRNGGEFLSSLVPQLLSYFLVKK
jgi:hypothetical protein